MALQKKKISPILPLLSKGLELWIRSRCKSIDEISVTLKGSSDQLIKGKINNGKIKAKGVLLQEFLICEAELNTDLIEIDFNLLNINKLINLKDSFRVQGSITIKEDNIVKIIESKRHKSIKKIINKFYKEPSNLKNLRINDNNIIVTCTNKSTKDIEVKALSINAYEGELHLSEATSSIKLKGPSDSNIYFEEINLERNKLKLIGYAYVNP